MVLWRSVHPRHLTTWRFNPNETSTQQFTTMTFRLKVDGLYVHLKKGYSELENWTDCRSVTFRPTVIIYFKGCDISSPYFFPTMCNKASIYFSRELWHFDPLYILSLCDNWFVKGYVKYSSVNTRISHISPKGTVSWYFYLFLFWKLNQYFLSRRRFSSCVDYLCVKRVEEYLCKILEHFSRGKILWNLLINTK
jgi:hypothetical protein